VPVIRDDNYTAPYAWFAYEQCQYMRGMMEAAQRGMLVFHPFIGCICLVSGLVQFVGKINLGCWTTTIVRGSTAHRIIGAIYVVFNVATTISGTLVGHVMGLPFETLSMLYVKGTVSVCCAMGGHRRLCVLVCR